MAAPASRSSKFTRWIATNSDNNLTLGRTPPLAMAEAFLFSPKSSRHEHPRPRHDCFSNGDPFHEHPGSTAAGETSAARPRTCRPCPTTAAGAPPCVCNFRSPCHSPDHCHDDRWHLRAFPHALIEWHISDAPGYWRVPRRVSANPFLRPSQTAKPSEVAVRDRLLWLDEIINSRSRGRGRVR